ncbi:MAG TPA: TonB-dependent receptor [Gemmatimonadaceae bacterium]|nr:TonB-dependent receptor [Gemmatimonadaceae bacterium]
MPSRLWLIVGVFSLASSFPPELLALQQDLPGPRTVIVIDSLDRSAFRNVGELLQARVPGLHVARTGDGGMRWFMRGPASIAESTPMVLIDDMPINVAGSAMRDIGTRPPILDEIELEDVERIEVLSGPATAVGHGTGAGNGVIRIVSFAPRAQRTSFKVATSVSTLDENVTYPTNAARAGIDTAGALVRRCTLQMEANELCTPTGPLTFRNVLESDSPFERAFGARATATVASGTERVAWRGGGTFDRQGSTDGLVADQRVHLRGTGGIRIAPNADVTVRGHWMRGSADLRSLNEPSLLSQGLLAAADTVWPGFVEPRVSPYHSLRYGVTAAGRWSPRSGLEARLTSGGARMIDENDLDYTFVGPVSQQPVDVDSRGERRRRDVNVRLDAEAQYRWLGMHQSTTVTVEHRVWKQEEEFVRILTQNGAPLQAGGFAINQRTGIAGAGLIQRFNLGLGLQLAGGVRLDQVRVNDVRWDAPAFPHLSLSWDARRYVPDQVARVRLRAALGDVANVPQTTRIFFFFPIAGETDRPKAEVTRERELGVDAAILEDRVGLSLTWYKKRTSNVLALFLGGPTARYARIEVLNRGVEASLQARILETSRLTWKAHARYTHNHNESMSGLGIAELGEAPGGPPFIFAPQWVLSGRPLGAHRIQPIVSIRDLDGDGRLDDPCFEDMAPCEVVVRRNGGFKPAYPPTSASVETSFRFGALTLSALVDHRRGHVMSNGTMQRRCVRECQALYDPGTSLRDQAEAMVAPGTETTVEDATYTKLREVSLRVEAPPSWTQALGASRLSISLAGRNVATWTDYSGLDPETTSAPWAPLSNVDNAAVPLPRRFVIRAEIR